MESDATNRDELDLDQRKLSLDERKWDDEFALRQREVEIKEADQVTRAEELKLKQEEHKRSDWRNPIVVALLAAALAAAGNAGVAVVNGILQRQLEDQKSEQARILEMIKTGDPDSAAENLDFLLKAGLVEQPERAAKLRAFLDARQPGSGPTLPAPSVVSGIVGFDDRIPLRALGPNHPLHQVANSIGRLELLREGQRNIACTGFLVGPDLLVTAGYCIRNAASGTFVLAKSDASYNIQLPPVETLQDDQALNYALLRLDGTPGDQYGFLQASAAMPIQGQPLSMVYYASDENTFMVVSAPDDCKVINVDDEIFHHLCDTYGGTSGAPVLTRDGKTLLGIHLGGGYPGKKAGRIDVILQKSQVLSIP